ncbi:MAG: YdiU family protein [Winogradskyella sp.]|uniref:protein adenylyltransferase SelO n=1 Tax=Winogradskyella sp. TaxID=1883156 RepID=UPI000F40D774|nr:YdiU family protein [Winogradskyella sp.]RNC85015.1 MAG: YdiU family protein [Winogradskyella sp.]
MQLNLKHSFTTELPSDSITENYIRQVKEACFSYVSPIATKKPELIHTSSEMVQNIGLTKSDINSEDFLNVFTGNTVLDDTKPYAMCYGGHQFGNWAGQLGDGRAINLFEVEHNNKPWVIQLKGAGKTPYSRSGDGLAVLRSSIREYLCSEAMHYLGVPTTRALSISLTGDEVLRDMLYDGNSAYEKGAIVSRVAPSFLRFGNYEIFAARQDHKTLKTLVDYTIKHHFPKLGGPSKDTYVKFFRDVMKRTLDMIIHWQRVGFVHGVMNTDNMSILGLTIDYGPYGWLDDFNFGWTPNTTDAQHKRYRYGNQPSIGLWNLYQLANALYPLIEDVEPLENILEDYKTGFETKSLIMMRSKLGLFNDESDDIKLVQSLENALHLTETDMTIFFRLLSNFKKDNSVHGFQLIQKAFYNIESITDPIKKQWYDWFENYQLRLTKEELSDKERKGKMDTVNPKYVLRNYMAQLAIDEADNGNYKLIDELFSLLKTPYSEQPEFEKWFAKRPEWARHKVGCSMLSCSS